MADVKYDVKGRHLPERITFYTQSNSKALFGVELAFLPDLFKVIYPQNKV